MNNQRLKWVDWLKALAIIGVIGIHCTSILLDNNFLFSFKWYQGVICGSIFRYAIVTFIMASGYLLLRKVQPITVIPKRLKRILIPFIFWLILYAIIKVAFKGVIGPTWNIFDLLTFIARGFLDPLGVSVQFWYIYMILGLYVLSPILSRWIQNAKLEEIEYLLLIWAIISLVQFIGLKSLLLDYLRYFTGAIGYFVLGYYLTIKDNSYLKNPYFGLKLFIIGSLITIIGTITLSHIIGHQTLFFIQLGDLTPGAFLQGVGLFIILYNMDYERIPPRINTYITKISKDSYGIYLVNILIVNVLNKIGLLNFEAITIIMVFIMVFAVLIISDILLDIMSKIPVLNYFTGKS